MPVKIKFTKDIIRNKLLTNDEWLVRGIVAIYNKQTDTERNAETTKVSNGVGFNGPDARLLSIYAKRIQQWYKTPEMHGKTHPLTLGQFVVARYKMKKYAGQLAKIANKEI
jgi:hypothetical protein